ncbi:hypothetical protein IJ670_07400, partial [bacterium]|nr:hypothetical protein [bacterium]
FDLTYKNSSSKSALAIKRHNLENWMINYAKNHGVYFCPDTLVKELIIENDVVRGVKTELEDYFAPVTVLADGVNSLLARQLKLRKDYKPKDIILSVKEVLKLDKKTIENRFNLKEDGSNGVNKQYFGADFDELKDYKNLFMMTYLYTFKDSVALGVGVNLEDLSQNNLNINDVLEAIKNHPDIKPLIQDGETIEYSAHLIPEGGFKTLPQLYSNGVLIAGDAAGFVNGVHFEGTNFALISGKLAAKAALDALEKQDYSSNTLKTYKKYLENSFILKDLYSYRNIIHLLYSRRYSLSYFYPQKIKEFFEIITSANCISKASQIRKFTIDILKQRGLIEIFKDIIAFSRCAIDLFFGK